MAAAAILDYWNSEILLAIGVEKVETDQHAKLSQNRSISCDDIKILSVFQDGGRRHLGFSKSLIFICCRYLESAVASLPNFVKSGRCIAEILRFFENSTWPPPPFLIFEIAKFYCLLRSRGRRRISMPNFVKIDHFVAVILQFFEFSMAVNTGLARLRRLWW